ncbi:MAG: helix-turn-helix domain-containing protein [Candidatus Omnitrophica bacterium]|nr:helix-turn-helix domain-containing protein [Candidatus Omnitrophota bacterium]
MRNRVFTPRQVAKICKVSIRSVYNWFDSGQLRGYHVPGSRDRRIPEKYLIRFMKEWKIPLGRLAEGTPIEVFCVSEDSALIQGLAQGLPKDAYRFAAAQNPFDAGMLVSVSGPDFAVVDFCIGRTEAKFLCGRLRRSVDFVDPTILALLPACESEGPGLDWLSPRNVLRKPIDAGVLTGYIQGH